MRRVIAVMIVVMWSTVALSESIHGGVTQVKLPSEDVILAYVEARGGFTVQLETKTASVEAQKMYIGDGKIAVELVAHASNGIFLQGDKYKSGDQFKKGATIKVKPGFKKASDLSPGDVYVTLPGVTFELPAK